ncbi:MAG: PspA/IM30 family protein [Synechocystis sp.]|nr:PspA/IM30 family protein [Synechocystis sp.]
MNLFRRVGRVVRSQLTQLQQSQEPPELLLERLLAEMELELIEMRRALAEAIATFKSTERQREAQQLIAQRWFDRAQFALDQSNEDLARDALTHRQAYQTNVASLDHSLQDHREVIERVRGELQDLERKYSALKTKKSLYLARLKSAIAAQKITEMTNTLDGNSASSLFDRIETKILELEVERELINPPPTAIDQQFQQLEAQSQVESTLQALKAQRQLPPS